MTLSEHTNHPMRFLTAFSHLLDSSAAVQSICEEVAQETPVAMLCYYTEEYCPEALSHALKSRLPNVPFVGCSSCKGIMTEHGYHEGPVVGVLFIHNDSACAYGSAIADLEHESHGDPQLIQRLIDEALQDADRVGEVPNLILLHATPGCEERYIDAIDETFGTHIPIIGGSAADNMIQSRWSLISDKGASRNGIAIQLCFTSKPLTTGFGAGYSPTTFKGDITLAQGRLICEIDGLPAKDVYQQWINEHAGESISEQYIFDHIARFPLGVVAGSIYQQPYYKLTHPIYFLPNGCVELFAEIQTGKEIQLMTGSREQLICRASRVVKEANTQNYHESLVCGAIIIHCAGSMLWLGDGIQQVYEKLNSQMNGQSFICPFTFGEQGRFIGGENAHGNLMISSVIFYDSE